MAEHVERIDEDEAFEFVGFRLSWGAIVAGLVIAVVTQIILSMIGLAIGFGALQFGPGGTLEEVGIGAGVWAVLTGLISLFVGGLAAGHFAGILTRLDGVLHGVLVWGLSVIIALWALSTGVTTLLGGMFGVAGQTLASAVGGASELGAAAIQEGRVPQVPAGDSERQIAAVLEQRGMSRAQAERAAREIRQTQRQVQLQAEQVRREAPQTAEQVAGTVSTAIWWILLATILSLIAAAGGAAITAEE
ncbi:MAG TPA: hypothetical protein VF212_03155 [Longimicrobiales bacterium]